MTKAEICTLIVIFLVIVSIVINISKGVYNCGKEIKVEKIINRLLKKSTSTVESSSEDNFLDKTFPQIGLRSIIQDPCLLDVIEQRIQEIQKSKWLFLCR